MTMLKETDSFYVDCEEPIKSCLMTLRSVILETDENISTDKKYRMPFFSYKNKWLCYLWIDKKKHEPYLGFVDGNKIEHPALEKGNRKRMRILRVKPNEDIDIETIELILKKAIQLHQN